MLHLVVHFKKPCFIAFAYIAFLDAIRCRFDDFIASALWRLDPANINGGRRVIQLGGVFP